VDAAQDRAREIWLLSEGAISMILVHGDRRYAAAAAGAAKRLIGGHASAAAARGKPVHGAVSRRTRQTLTAR
jgi:hypothetical protein